MTPPDPALDDAARAVLDGSPVDWDGLASSADLSTRAITAQLKVLSALAETHRGSLAGARPHLPVMPGDAAANPLERWGHLRVLERIGSGAFGEVYRAWDTRLDREVALKLLPADVSVIDDASPVIKEGRLMARVRHQHVATIYGAELIDGYVGLWMELVRGRTLEDLLRTGHRFDVPEFVAIGLDLCSAVASVHAAGLLHRDIKAQNVMREESGRIVLTDFGTGWDGSTVAAHAAGTPLYLAPEVLNGSPASVQSDVYSVGVLLYRLLAGDYPVRASSLDELRRAHAAGDRVSLAAVRPDLPQRVVRVVERALTPEPQQRYHSCEQLAADLGAATPRSGVSRRVLVAAGAAAALIMGALAWSGTGSRLSRVDSTAANLMSAGAASPQAQPVIAVLPFRNLSDAPDSDLLVDGLTYELIRNLAIVNGLQVKSATSSFALKGKGGSLADIGRQLGANLVVEGSVSLSGGQWRVIAQLARVDDDHPLWSGKFDRRADDVFGVQDDVALAVVNELRVTLDAGQRRYDLDPSQAALYLRARALVERRGKANTVAAAIPLLEQIIDRDPSFAPAYAGLADAYSFMAQDLPDVGGLDPEQAVALMRPLVARALELDPLLAEAHAASGFLHAREHAWTEAERDFRRAIELNPSLTHAYTNFALTTLLPAGRFAEAEQLLLEARTHDPLSASVLRALGFGQINEQRYEAAIASLNQAKALDPTLDQVDLLLARARTFGGHVTDAMPYWDSVSDRLGSQHWMAYAYVQTGRREEIERLVRTHRNPYRRAIMYAALGDRDRALAALDRAAVEAPHRVVRLLTYPEMTPLRDDPRFAAIRARFGLR